MAKKCNELNYGCQCCVCDRKKHHKGDHRIKRAESSAYWSDEDTKAYCEKNWSELDGVVKASTRQLEALHRAHRKLANTVGIECEREMAYVECAILATMSVMLRALRRYMTDMEQFRRPEAEVKECVGAEVWEQYEIINYQHSGNVIRPLMQRLGVE